MPAPNPFRRRPVRPLGITLIALWSVVVGVSVPALAAYAVYVLHLIPRVLAAFVAFPEGLLAVAGLVALLEFVAAYELWKVRPWGWALAVGFSVAGLLFGAFTPPYGVAGVVFGLVSLAYLQREGVRRPFGLAAKAAASK